MPPVSWKPKTKLEWNEIDKSRDDQLGVVVDRASLGGGRGLRDLRWFDIYEDALIAFEDGRPKKLINLEKSLGIVWDGNAYRRSSEEVEVYKRTPSPLEVEAIVDRACAQIKRQKRLPSWLRWLS